ncbi:MAG: hypothetical protein DCC49_04750 [Acidobacteria bacterium]|nr:MAG: hypothetical protein DCC49_04750 [Acidobacteriota bacterium]
MKSGEEIKSALDHFARKWRGYSGSEKSEAQTYLNELLACFGTDRLAAGAKFEDPQKSDDGAGFIDMFWPGVCIIEMKRPSEAGRLSAHREQAKRYWTHSADVATDTPAPPYLVLCAFSMFEIWEPGRFPNAPRAEVTLDELPDRYDALLFLAGEEPTFAGPRHELTVKAAGSIAALYQSLADRKAAPVKTLREFVLQCVWCLFAESLEMISGRPVEKIVEALMKDPNRSSSGELGQLFDALNEKKAKQKGGIYAGTPYANGGLFERPARVHLEPDELELLAEAARHDWRQVDPTIFGSLMEGCLGRGRRWELGAHYTHESDIMKIVRPTIVEPWQALIDSVETPEAAESVLRDLCEFKVLDPACGCGNFLYVAYRELRSLEAQLKARVGELEAVTGAKASQRELPGYPISNIYGIEIEEFAVMISRVTLWMGHKLAADRFGVVEPVLPLVDLANIQQADALRVDWPEVDAIIGNPPFHGSQQLRRELGDDYVEWLKGEFKCGVKDFCAYWYRRAADNLQPGQRAGLVGTNSIAQNRARSAALDYVVAKGGVITNAIASQKWPGEAKVHVAIVNWQQSPADKPDHFELDGEEVDGISTDLRTPGTSAASAVALEANRGFAFQGPIPVGAGFILDNDEAAEILARDDANYAEVVRPYLIGDDIAKNPALGPTRWIIDFASMPLEDAMRYPAAIEVVRKRVKPEREGNRMKRRREKWWQFGSNANEMRDAINGLPRFIASTATGKRAYFIWCGPTWCLSNLTNVFAFDDDYTFGILTSRIHTAWAWARSSTLKGDIRYTPSTVFESFPFPWPVGEDESKRVTAAAIEIDRLRRELCAAEQFGLTTLYNRVDEGAYVELAKAHSELDLAVVACYGWPKAAATVDAEIVRRLLDLNQQIAEQKREYRPFAARLKSGESVLF